MEWGEAGVARRDLLAGFAAAAPAFALPGMGRAAQPRAAVTLYSPAPEGSPLHRLNLVFAARAGVAIRAVALPESIHRILSLPPERRVAQLPIVTNVDFALARAGGGPDWHGYPRACPDLRFVAGLYDVGLGLFVSGSISAPDDLRGRRIAVPARPSAVRMLTEWLLRDGWGLGDGAVLVDMDAGEAAGAFARGAVDATSWNLVLPGSGPMLGTGLAGRHLPVSAEALARIGRAHGLRLGHAQIGGGVPPLLSFAQGVAAWDGSDPALVRALAACADGVTWPGLAPDALHPALRG